MCAMGNFWNQDELAGVGRPRKAVTSMQLRNFGLSIGNLKHVEKLEELRSDPPNMIIAECKKTMKIRQNFSEEQTLKKGVNYVMSLGVYQQIHVDPTLGMQVLKPASIKFKSVYRPYIGQDLSDKTLIVFRTGGIGDLLFIKPNLQYLKEKYPTCYIQFSCAPQYQSMISTWDCVDQIVDLPFPLSYLIHADYHSVFEGVIERCKEAESENSYRLFSRWMGLSLPDDLLIPKQEINEDILQIVKDVVENKMNIKDKFLEFQIRASSPIRTPNLIFWRQLIDELTDRGHNIVITDSKRTENKVEKFIIDLKNKDKVFNFAKYSETIDYTICLTKLASMVVATDSALNHIAASVGTKSYGIYGPFPGRIRLETYGKLSRWVDAQMHCAPCYLHTYKPCPQASMDGFSPCYNTIDIKKTCNEIEDFLNDKDIPNS
jgi:ADP-heptose:LPS heptosyltransferase